MAKYLDTRDLSTLQEARRMARGARLAPNLPDPTSEAAALPAGDSDVFFTVGK